ncbi:MULTISPECIES: hypothetical protein [Methylobacterium]|jgi:hypothetical protein|uniref:Uncharacterized protein n=2 Tax=Methylobacterium TaxID=407 RepID=A0A0C6FGY9_9HYPH|nr:MULTISPECIES: hypothetical protein [Methylobacterium]MBK3398946.1 hypothetical protein [Methylobacterium ajmalii]MBK3408167.1 hypothetical protein [Methylobacterium ajmalii]MBK3425772.1 hypothetical protein [Methylobacterium ajmalii]MBZ6414306.1 hypothetical protein [Methylobacterium sp.]SFE79444.1 hypothetical protein SAMN04487844_10613 [Methylobacterium sp. yr596]
MTTPPRQNRFLALALPIGLLAGTLAIGFWTLDQIRITRARALTAQMWSQP